MKKGIIRWFWMVERHLHVVIGHALLRPWVTSRRRSYRSWAGRQDCFRRRVTARGQHQIRLNRAKRDNILASVLDMVVPSKGNRMEIQSLPATTDAKTWVWNPSAGSPLHPRRKPEATIPERFWTTDNSYPCSWMRCRQRPPPYLSTE